MCSLKNMEFFNLDYKTVCYFFSFFATWITKLTVIRYCFVIIRYCFVIIRYCFVIIRYCFVIIRSVTFDSSQTVSSVGARWQIWAALKNSFFYKLHLFKGLSYQLLTIKLGGLLRLYPQWIFWTSWIGFYPSKVAFSWIVQR